MKGFKLNRKALEAQTARIVRKHADAGGAYLMEVLSQPGEGTHWPENPNPSSAPGDYPTYQTGALMESVNVVQGDMPLSFKVGFFAEGSAEGFDHAVQLESQPPERGGRQPLEKLWSDPAFRKAVVEGKT